VTADREATARVVFAARWAAALHAEAGSDESPPDVAGTQRLLGRFVDRLADALLGEPFRPSAGHEVGAELFGARVGTDRFGATVACLASLPDALGFDRRVTAERMPVLLGALVSGYTSALRACTLEELEAHAVLQGGPTRAARATAERAQRDEAARYRAVLAGVEVPVALCDPRGRFVDANPAFVDLLRHRVPYLRAHTLFDLAHDEDAPMLARVVDRDLVHGRYRRVRTEVRLRRRRGSLICVPLALSLTRDAAGEPVYLVCAATPRRASGELVTTATGPDGITLSLLDIDPADVALEDDAPAGGTSRPSGWGTDGTRDGTARPTRHGGYGPVG
jgi:PAS domain S-box-containing protein